jgi:hypothetical protein
VKSGTELRKLGAVGLAVLLAVSPLTTYAAERFGNVRLMVNTGGKAEEQDAVLVLDNSALVLESRAGTALKTMRYDGLKSLEYSYSKSPRWKSGTAAAIAVGVFAIPIFFMKGKKHWLTAVGDGDFALVRLDKNNYKLILPALEAKTGVKVETVADEK